MDAITGGLYKLAPEQVTAQLQREDLQLVETGEVLLVTVVMRLVEEDGVKAWRVRQIQESHARIRALVRASRLVVEPRTPPDILGCYVLVPAGGRR